MKNAFAAVSSLFIAAAPVAAAAQHSHGASPPGGPRHDERASRKEPPPQPGLLPVGAPRGVEVLVLDQGFSPAEVAAEVGEDIVLLVRRSAETRCAVALTLPGRGLTVPLPLDQTVPIALRVDRPESIELRCDGDGTKAEVVVRPRP